MRILGTPYLILEEFKSNLRKKPPVTYAFDTMGSIQGRMDHARSTTTFVYDHRGVVLTKTKPLSKRTTFTYQNGGRLKSVTVGAHQR